MKIIFDSPVPYIPLSADQKDEFDSILREGNLLLKKYHSEMKLSQGILRHNRTNFLNEIVNNSIKGKDCIVHDVSINSSDLDKILKVKEVEYDILCAYSNLVSKIAYKWSKRDFDSSVSKEDLTNEAYQAAINAIAHFTDEKIKFITFLHHCVNRHLAKLCNRTNGMSALSPRAIELKKQYLTLASEEGSTFDRIVEKMNVSQKEVKILNSALRKVQNETSIDEDYELVVADSCEIQNGSEVFKIIDSVDLTDLEKAVLEGFVQSSSDRLGLNSVSKNLINPKTNKPYSRMAFSLAWKRIKEKISKAYEKVA